MVDKQPEIATFFGGKPTPAKPTPVKAAPKARSPKKGTHPDLVIVPKSANKTTTSKHFASGSGAKSADIVIDSSDDDVRPVASSSKKHVQPDSDEEMAPPSKGKVLKRKAAVVTSDSEASPVQPVKPPKKPVAKVGTKVTKKPADEDSTDDDDDTSKSKGKGKAPAKKAKKSVTTDDDDEVEGKGKGKAKAKSAPAKKAKKEDVVDPDTKPKWKFVPKTGPVAPGSKEVPVGADNCLAGLTFVFTGELESLSREEGQDLVKRYGGRCTSAPSGKTSYVVLGSDAGPSKLKMIEAKKIPTLTEDTFLQLIGQRPSGEADEKFIAKKKEETAKVIADAKTIGLTKDAPEHLTQLWTVKYAPQTLAQICGNKGLVEKMARWIEAWPKSLAADFKKPGPDAMGGFRCILISGSPGIGKTTAAHLVAKLAGYNILELNASDTRSKKLLETAFKSTIENTTLAGFFKTEGGADSLSVNTKSIIIMDEVDGMSAGDRGGVGALNALIKKTKVPIIAICNDKSTPKMKPFTSTCFQMVFKKPSANEIRSRMMSIAFKEGLKIDAKAMDQLVEGSQSDVRQIINMLSTWRLSAEALDFDNGKKLASTSQKNSIQTPWTLHSKLTGPQAFAAVSKATLSDKMDLYFNDHSIMPLFVQENYLKMRYTRSAGLSGHEKTLKDLELMSAAADSMSDGDLVDRMIHGDQQWSLMPVHAIFSCVKPAYFTYGVGSGYPSFPAWLGKNSTQGKLQRLLGEIQIRMRLRISGDRKEIRQSYLPLLWEKLVMPLVTEGSTAIDEIMKTMDDYYLTKEDWDAIVELGIGDEHNGDAILKRIPPAVKSSFTRAYNKVDHPMPFASKAEGGKPKKLSASGPAPDQEDVMVEEEEIISDEEEEGEVDIKKDKMIKEKKAKAKPKPRVKKEK